MNFPPPLSAKFSKSFAYDTVKDRIPRILTKVVDVCHRQVSTVNEKYGEEGRKDATEVVSKLSQLRSEIMTDKVITLLDDDLIDVEMWNSKRKEYCDTHGHPPSWFTAPWLYVECFMYRRIAGSLKSSRFLKEFDPFSEQKDRSLQQSENGIETLTMLLNKVIENLRNDDEEKLKQYFTEFIEVSLWGNKCDLSISGGDENHEASVDLHQNLELFRKRLLVDDTLLVWDGLWDARKNKEQVRVDIVLDNSGYELFTDLILADFLLSFNVADQIVLHPKPVPWFVSDVTSRDFVWTLDYLTSSSNELVAKLARKWKNYTDEKKIVLIEDNKLLKFYSLPDPYCNMREVAPLLHNELSKSDLIIFKGDLNYRKLVGDLDWPHETNFKLSLRGFSPANFCSLRTLKANVVVGLKPGQALQVESQDKNWMVTGNYAVVQYLRREC